MTIAATALFRIGVYLLSAGLGALRGAAEGGDETIRFTVSHNPFGSPCCCTARIENSEHEGERRHGTSFV